MFIIAILFTAVVSHNAETCLNNTNPTEAQIAYCEGLANNDMTAPDYLVPSMGGLGGGSF
jgi:hypothetical protein